MNIYYGLIKGDRYVLHQLSNRKLWEDFITGETTNIPDIVIADANEFLFHFEGGLTVEECSEFHFWDYEKGIEKICNNLSDENWTWLTKTIGEGEKR